jgi:UDP-GlcNAc:undecaprenyl-phosphate GlcNAc-1-phosphate transferase
LALAVLLIAAIPVYDLTVVLLKRWRRRQPLMRGDRGHISHRLSRLGLRPWASLAVVAALQLALGAGALLLPHLDLLTASIVATQAVCISLVALLLEATRDHVM